MQTLNTRYSIHEVYKLSLLIVQKSLNGVGVEVCRNFELSFIDKRDVIDRIEIMEIVISYRIFMIGSKLSSEKIN